MTPSDNVRKAVEEIFKLPCCRYTEEDWDGSLSRQAMSEIISRHCHVTEMEAVVEKAREALRWCKDKISLPGSNAHSVINEALSSIDALKGDKR